MGKRVTTAELSEKLDKLIDVLTTQAMPADSTQTLVEDDAKLIVETPDAEGIETVEVDGAYLDHQKGKAQAHATAKGENVVLYARQNKQGEIKVAYALQERYDTQIARQPSHRGPIATFSA